MMKSIIIDDEKMSREIIKSMVSKHPDVEVLADFDSPVSAFGYLTQNNDSIDFIFLDIHLPEFTGFDFLNSLTTPPPVILISNDSEKALKAFEYDNIIDYLLKPIDFTRFAKSMTKMKKNLERNSAPEAGKSSKSDDDKLFINVNKRLIKIDFDDIDFIEASGDYVRINTEDKKHLVHSTMKNVESKLPSNQFFKVHRSYIINLNKIIDIEDNTALIGKNVIPISQAKKSELMDKLNRL